MASYKDVTSRKAVLSAIAECDELGPEAFRRLYGFHEAHSYVLRYEGREYDSKAILGVAHRFQFPEVGALHSGSFSGGKAHAAGYLCRLGFHVDGIRPRDIDWDLSEVEVIVDEYFAIFVAQHRPSYDRGGHLRRILERLRRRNESAVSRKLSNISAILADLGLPMIRGFGPLGNKQTLLAAVTLDWLSDHPDIFDEPRRSQALRASQPPVTSMAAEVPPPDDRVLRTVHRERRGCRVDFAERDQHNRRLGKAGELWAYEYLKAELFAQGRANLAAEVKWVSQCVGDGLGYDIASFGPDGEPVLVEVKTTNGGIAAPFMLTVNEVVTSGACSGRYILMRLFDFLHAPKFYRLKGPLDQTCQLRPVAFAALPQARATDDGYVRSRTAELA